MARAYQTLYVVEVRSGWTQYLRWLPSIGTTPFIHKEAAEHRAEKFNVANPNCYRVSKFIRARRPKARRPR